jgi:hypothetical protein
MPGIGGAALETASKSAAEAAAKAAAEDAAKAAAKSAGEAAAKTAAEDAAKAAAKTAAEDAAKAAAKSAAESAAKDAAKTAAKNAAETAAKDASKMSAKDVAKYAAGAAAAGVGVYLFASSSEAADKSNSTPRGITKLESADGKSKRVLNVYFTPAIRILKSDIITISGSKTVPSIDGPQTVKSVLSDGEIVIDFGKDITTMTEGGSIKVQTTASAQAQSSVDEAATGLGQTVGGAAGGLTSGLFGGLLDGLGFDPMWLVWGGIAVVVILLLVFIVPKFFTPKPSIPVPL